MNCTRYKRLGLILVLGAVLALPVRAAETPGSNQQQPQWQMTEEEAQEFLGEFLKESMRPEDESSDWENDDAAEQSHMQGLEGKAVALEQAAEAHAGLERHFRELEGLHERDPALRDLFRNLKQMHKGFKKGLRREAEQKRKELDEIRRRRSLPENSQSSFERGSLFQGQDGSGPFHVTGSPAAGAPCGGH